VPRNLRIVGQGGGEGFRLYLSTYLTYAMGLSYSGCEYSEIFRKGDSVVGLYEVLVILDWFCTSLIQDI
jgi:hypothetical protein